MQTKSFSKGVEERNAYCCNCDWHYHGMIANTRGRLHVQQTGHAVDVYTETRTRIKSVQ